MKQRITISLGGFDSHKSVKFMGEIWQMAEDRNRIIVRLTNMAQVRDILHSRPFEGVPVVFVNECYDSYRLSFRRQPNTHYYIMAKEVTEFNVFKS